MATDFGLGGIIASVLAGVAGGQTAEKQPKTPSPGGLGSILGGGVGGGLGGLLTSVLGGGLAGTDASAVIGQAVGGGVLGTIVTVVLGLILKKK
ncbi:hypothetical protein GCM10022234_15240 [Aeromicrobium panaciterrae]|uniref:hypothetical protein n=1 Tax=Aeromicrobium panaciterrae TaxID=363861 RepID=UPI0031D642D3